MSLLAIRRELRKDRRVMTIGAMVIAVIAGSLHPGHYRDKVIRDANGLAYRLTEARLADRFAHRPLRRIEHVRSSDLNSLRSTAAMLRKRWQTLRDPKAGRKSAEAELLAGNTASAAALLTEVLEHESGRKDLLSAIYTSHDAALLTDFSAALLQRPRNTRLLVLAFEAADRAWRLAATSPAAWNRALATERVGVAETSAQAWRDAAALETSGDWNRDARRHEEAAKLLVTRPIESPELFFHDALIVNAAAGVGLGDLLSDDRLASDTARRLAGMTAQDHDRLRNVLRIYANGRNAFARDDLDQACGALSAAERGLTSLKMPLMLLVREQNIRCRCTRAQPGCLDDIRKLKAELVALGRYPWLIARTEYAEGQALYRQGRIYDAAKAFHSALKDFRAVGDPASAGLTHSVLGNTNSVAGEADAALDHHLAAVRLRYTYSGDRRRIQLEDAMLFLLRHGYVATAELLLGELSIAPVTEGGRVMEALLRGVIDFRRGRAAQAQSHFEHARRLTAQIDEETLRLEANRSILLAESGCGIGQRRPSLVDIDAAAAVTQQEEVSLWLPRMLTERGIEYEAANELKRAEADFLRAISMLEKREPRVDQSSLVLGTGAPRESAFDRAVRLYLSQQRIAAALDVAQRSTSARISALHGRAAGMRNVFRSLGSQTAAKQEDVQRLLPDGHVAIAQYLLSDALITWVVTPTRIRAVRRPIPAEHLIDAVGDLHACVRRGRCDDGAELERVSSLLLRDWIEHVPRGATLWLQRPVELQAVPFAMLKTRDGERLLSRNPLTNGPALSTMIRAHRDDAMRRGNINALFVAASGSFGDLEPLPMTTVEVTRSARFYDAPHIDKLATRRTFLHDVLPYRIVHFAGHVLVNDEQPLLSALALDDGLLYIHEIDRRVFSGVRLVILSGCDSGRTPKPVMSVANALLSQGVPSVVYTIWPVEDSIAAEFAVAFHRALTSGKTRAESLQSAALWLRRRNPGRPNTWTAFQLAGAPGLLTGTE